MQNDRIAKKKKEKMEKKSDIFPLITSVALIRYILVLILSWEQTKMRRFLQRNENERILEHYLDIFHFDSTRSEMNENFDFK